MKIAKALKLKNKLAGELNILKSRIQNNNRFIKGNKTTYEPGVLLIEYQEKMNELITLKVKISEATKPVFTQIIRMGELKAQLLMMRSLQCTEGIDEGGYRTTIQEYEVHMKEGERDKLVKELEKEIEDIQETLDTFNATTLI